MHRHSGRLFGWILGVAAAAAMRAVAVQAGEPVVGVDVGAAFPTEHFRDTADPGGAIAPFAGYRLFTLGETVAVSLLAQPQFAAFQTTVDRKPESDVTSVFSFSLGPRLSLLDENVEAYFSAQGGYYTDITGPLNGEDGGWNIAGGLNYSLTKATALGLFARRDQSSIRAERGSGKDLTFITTGFGLQHRFLPAPPKVAEAPPPPPPPPPPPAPVKKKIVLRGVNFDFDKSNIRADARPILDEAVATLKEERAIKISVDGHTDSRGTDDYNQGLSERRANSVADHLSGGGIDRARMTVGGFGESQPVASNDTDEGRAQNRRVELKVLNQPE
jgi:outer membrane protein OmpA-like peptidoglycan-associated protein